MVLTLALEAFKLRHGSLPHRLDELVGPCLDRLPVDPCTGKPFVYFRSGVNHRLGDMIGSLNFATRNLIPPQTPLLWSPGPDNAVPPPDEDRDWRRDWANGRRVELEWAFPIPAATPGGAGRDGDGRAKRHF